MHLNRQHMRYQVFLQKQLSSTIKKSVFTLVKVTQVLLLQIKIGSEEMPNRKVQPINQVSQEGIYPIRDHNYNCNWI